MLVILEIILFLLIHGWYKARIKRILNEVYFFPDYFVLLFSYFPPCFNGALVFSELSFDSILGKYFELYFR